jgi:uncharacterized membrane-anchored protein YitT (DUF2179 family)
MTKFKSVTATIAIALAIAAFLAASQAFAAEGPLLAPGKPSGVQKAQRGSPNPLLIGGVAVGVVAAVGIAVALSNDSSCGDACATSTTTT